MCCLDTAQCRILKDSGRFLVKISRGLGLNFTNALCNGLYLHACVLKTHSMGLGTSTRGALSADRKIGALKTVTCRKQTAEVAVNNHQVRAGQERVMDEGGQQRGDFFPKIAPGFFFRLQSAVYMYKAELPLKLRSSQINAPVIRRYSTMIQTKSLGTDQTPELCRIMS